jgi:hypothetical protein
MKAPYCIFIGSSEKKKAILIIYEAMKGERGKK